LKYIWSKEDQGVTAKEVYDYMSKEDKSLSKAAILGFLDELCIMDVLRVTSESCRGGIRKRYFQTKSREKFIERFVEDSIEEMKIKFPQETLQSLSNIIQRDSPGSVIMNGYLSGISSSNNLIQESLESRLFSLNNPMYV
jgi:hypothetical protein